jgi:hypothetical protein
MPNLKRKRKSNDDPSDLPPAKRQLTVAQEINPVSLVDISSPQQGS